MRQWQPDSWQDNLSCHTPTYDDAKHYYDILRTIHHLRPLISLGAIRQLKYHLAKATLGESFLLQSGDSLERFADCHAQSIQERIKPLLHNSLILSQQMKKPVIKVGRIAGHYARSLQNTIEIRQGSSLPSYFGDLVNRPGFSKKERTPDPKFLLQAYRYALWTLNHLKELSTDNFHALYQPHCWEADFFTHFPQREKYLESMKEILLSINKPYQNQHKHLQITLQLPVYTSHEMLHLRFEQSMTQQEPLTGKWYNLGTHFPWVHLYNNEITNAHIEYIRGLHNPIAVSVGPDMQATTLAKLVSILNTDAEPGRLTLICRLGKSMIRQKLPAFISAVKATKKPVLWSCDPLRGNIIASEKADLLTFDDVLTEARWSFEIHHENNSRLSGLHLETTDKNIQTATLTDSGLSYEQSLKLGLSMLDNI